MNIDNKDDENNLCKTSKNEDLYDFKALLNESMKEPIRSFINNPEFINDKCENLRTINIEDIYELMKIIEQLNNKIESVIKGVNEYESLVSRTPYKNIQRKRNVNSILFINDNTDKFFPRKRTHAELETLGFGDLNLNNDNNYYSATTDFKEKIFKLH